MRRPPPLAERIQTRLPDTAICRSDERTLSERFEVSRTPAREAILQLAAAGLVRTTPRRGAVVPGISAEEAVNMMETLAALEARSEEHTSELQSLMRHSSAVYCLKQKNTTHHDNPHTNI